MLDRPFRLAILLAPLAACSAPPPAAGPGPAAPVAAASSAAPGSFDGVYRGTGTGNSGCGGTSSFGYPLRVASNVASIQTNTAGVIEGPIAPDGSLTVQHGRQTLQGQFSGNQFNGTLAFGRCGYTLSYARR